ncbi:hypothetical protein F511_40353 [Dorcoceras hygrometricum]|uniref:Uncharacterized protein n=1 Tax=Dorcoceras hygrometricum TaxID=472368 RepID=A0A2Z7C1W0_9LAMI|nr:hypothetical protein F511_40353 [Dorcoceras hygrometricum]
MLGKLKRKGTIEQPLAALSVNLPIFQCCEARDFAAMCLRGTLPTDCDDITTDVIIADSRSCASSQLLIVMTSSLLLILPVDCDDITADVIIADSRSCASSQLLIVMTSSLLLMASSRIYADVITADSRFLFASIQQLISSTSEHCSLLLNCSSSLQLLSSSADCDDITDGPLGCSSWFPFDVPAGPSSSSSACSWFLSFQLVHYAPA